MDSLTHTYYPGKGWVEKANWKTTKKHALFYEKYPTRLATYMEVCPYHRSGGKYPDLANAIKQHIRTPSLTTLRSLQDAITRSYYIDYSYLTAWIKEEINLYVLPVWIGQPWAKQEDTTLCHVSETDPTKVAYAPSWEKLHRVKDGQIVPIYTKTAPGKYLQQFYPQLSQEEIRKWAEKQIATANTDPVIILDNNNYSIGQQRELMREWVDLYRNIAVDYSCMRGHSAVSIYGLPQNNIGLAYMQNPAGCKYARSIVNTKTKEYVRIYPSGDSGTAAIFDKKLAALGYYPNREALDGIHLVYKVEDESRIVCPYLDGDMSISPVRTSNTEYLLVSNNGEYGAQETGGYANAGSVCDVCGDFHEPEDLIYIEDEEIQVCPHCFSAEYVWATGRYAEVAIRTDSAIYCEDDGDWYTPAGATHFDILQAEAGDQRGNYYYLDNLVSTYQGYAHVNEAVKLDIPDPDGNDYALKEDSMTLPDGRVIHKDSYESVIQEEAEQEDEVTA